MAQAAALKSAREEFDHRARVLRDRLSDADFLANRGLGNEVGIYLFCYDPALELEARDLVARLVRESENGSLPFLLTLLSSILPNQNFQRLHPGGDGRLGVVALLLVQAGLQIGRAHV